MAAECATHIFSSLYTFSEAAKHEILEKFSEKVVATNVHLKHAPDEMFILTCPEEDNTSFPAFMDIMMVFMKSELAKEPDMFEDIKVKRMADTQTETEEVPIVAEIAKQSSREQTHKVAVGEHLLIPHETFSRDWSSKKNVRSASRPRLDNRLLGLVGTLTNCRVELTVDEKKFTVKGETNEDVDKAMLKLDALDRWTYQKSTLPHSYDFQFSEGELDIMLQLKTLKEVRDRRLHTTLIPFNSPKVKYLSSCMTVLMIKNGVEVLNTSSGRPALMGVKQCLLWNHHLFKPLKDETFDPMDPRQEFSPPSSTVSAMLGDTSTHPIAKTVDQWVTQSASAELANPFAPPVVKDRSSSVQEAFIPPPIEPSPALPPPRKRYAKTRKPIGVAIPSKDDSTEPVAPSSHEPLAKVESEIVSKEKVHSEHSEGPQRQLKDGPCVTSFEFFRQTTDPRIQLPLSANAQVLEAPPIEPPYMPTDAKSSASDGLSSDLLWERSVVLKARPGKLVDDTEPKFQVKDSVQAVDEFDTRQLRHTMNQRKSASSGASRSSFVSLLKEFELAISCVLKVAQESWGPVKLRVEIGRILIDHLSGSSEYKKRPFPVSEWHRAFPNQMGSSKIQSSFTNMLTSSPLDAQFTLTLKLPSGRKIFLEEPIERVVSYHFDCITKTNDRVSIEVDENGTFKVRCNKYLIGAINWHFPKRFWDARLTVESSEQLSLEMHKAAQEMVDNLCIRPSPNQKTFQLFTKVEKGDLRIQSVVLRRETCHQASEYPNTVLHLCEVQELSLLTVPDTKIHYQASLDSKRSTSSLGNRIWWEVSLSSKVANETFKENEVLEVGDVAGWTAQELVGREVVKDLSYVARDLVERIDAVGSSNKGPKGGSATKASERPKPVEMYW